MYYDKIYLTVPEVAKYLSVSTSKIYKLTSKNEIPHYKPCGKNLFKKLEIDSWVDESLVPTIEVEVNGLISRLGKGGSID